MSDVRLRIFFQSYGKQNFIVLKTLVNETRFFDILLNQTFYFKIS
jgi:hypothetical protein